MSTRIVVIMFTIVPLLLVSANSSEAISRYNANSLTCAQAKRIIAEQGAVIIRYSSRRVPGLVLHNRFVAHGGFCQLDERPARQSIPTADNPKCRLKYCKTIEPRFGRDDFRGFRD